MTKQHPITPPPELVQQWASEWMRSEAALPVCRVSRDNFMAARAAEWGADTELEACCEWLSGCGCESYGRELRAARRPKPPSLKEQALEALGPEPLPETGPTGDTILNKSSIERHRHIRRALEALPDD